MVRLGGWLYDVGCFCMAVSETVCFCGKNKLHFNIIPAFVYLFFNLLYFY